MLDVFQKFATDTNAELNGTWKDIGDGASLLIARANNARYGKLLSKLYKVHQDVLEQENEAADALSDKVMVEVFAKTILLGWKGLSYKGQEIQYSVEQAEVLLAHSEFRALVARLSNDVDNFRAKLEAKQGEA